MTHEEKIVIAKAYLEKHGYRVAKSLVNKTQKGPMGEYLRMPQVIELVPFSGATVWRKCKEGTFPQPVKLSANVTAWRKADVLKWFETIEEGQQ